LSALWARSLFRSDTFGWAGWRNQPAGTWGGIGFNSENGRLIAYSFSGTAQFDNPRSIPGNSPSMKPHFVHEAVETNSISRPSFRWDRFRMGDRRLHSSVDVVGVPLWFITLPFAVAPVRFGSRWLRHRCRERRRGLCPACLYNLTGNVSGRCPECGSPVGGE